MKGEQPAVFIDRDGTLIEMADVLTEPSQVNLLPNAGRAIAELNRRGFLVIVLTNQPIIEKGLLAMDGLEKIHEKLRVDLAAAGAYFDGIYTCPHRYRAEGQCDCRKPGLGLIKEAQADFPIDMPNSWLVGDRLRDIETGKRARLRTILVATGGESKDDEFFPNTKPNYSVPDLQAAVDVIV